MSAAVPAYLPNLLSSLRITLAPAMLGAAYSNSKVGFVVLLGLALVTDSVDGPLARRLGVSSTFGDRLDRWGDGLTAVCGAIGVVFLWLDVVEREWPWMLTAVTGYVWAGLRRVVEPARATESPGWLERLCGWLVPLALIPLILDNRVEPFAAAAVLHASVGAWRLAGVCRERPAEVAA